MVLRNLKHTDLKYPIPLDSQILFSNYIKNLPHKNHKTNIN